MSYCTVQNNVRPSTEEPLRPKEKKRRYKRLKKVIDYKLPCDGGKNVKWLYSWLWITK